MNTNLNHNEQIKIIDRKYKKQLLSVCHKTIKQFIGVPLEKEDIYYEFLFYISTYLKRFDSKKGKLLSFLQFRIRDFARNKCRSWCKRNDNILNFPNDYFDNKKASKKSSSNIKLESDINLKKLDNDEKIVVNYIAYQSMKKCDVAAKMGTTIFQVNKILESIKKKLYNNILKN